MISDNGLRLSHRTIPTSNFKIIQHLHLLEVVVVQRKKLLGRSKQTTLAIGKKTDDTFQKSKILSLAASAGILEQSMGTRNK